MAINFDPRKISGMVDLPSVTGEEFIEVVQNGLNYKAPLRVLIGPTGDTGEDGLSAYQLALLQGFQGTLTDWLESLKGEQGLPGTTTTIVTEGASAYDIAVANGFNGTETEWLLSLVGPAGEATNTIIVDGNVVTSITLGNGLTGTIVNGVLTIDSTTTTTPTTASIGKVQSVITLSNGGVSGSIYITGLGSQVDMDLITASVVTGAATRVVLANVPTTVKLETFVIEYGPGFNPTNGFEVQYPEPFGNTNPLAILIPNLSMFNYADPTVLQPAVNQYTTIEGSDIVTGKSGLVSNTPYRWRIDVT